MIISYLNCAKVSNTQHSKVTFTSLDYITLLQSGFQELILTIRMNLLDFSWLSIFGTEENFPCFLLNGSKVRGAAFTASSEMVFCFQNCSNLLWEKKILVIEKNSRLKAENLQNF